VATRRSRHAYNDALGPGTHPVSRLSPASLSAAKTTCLVLENIPLVLLQAKWDPIAIQDAPANEVARAKSLTPKSLSRFFPGICCPTFSIGADQMIRRTICSLVGIKGTHVSHLVQTGWRRIEIFISSGLQRGGPAVVSRRLVCVGPSSR
jgi:hypothetical protein